MNTEQREEIESAIKELEDSKDIGVIDSLTWPEISTLIQFARQQLNLRVNVDLLARKLADTDIVMTTLSGDAVPDEAIPAIEAIVLQCLTTTPEEKE